MTKILVTGGAGYLGCILIGQLLEQGCRVRVFDNLLYGDGGLSAYKNDSNLELQVGDITNSKDLHLAFEDVNTVVHLAAIVGDSACEENQIRTVMTNCVGTEKLARSAKACGVKRFVFASTCSVYGISNKYLSEYSELNPLSLYAKTKVWAEKKLQKMRNKEFTSICLRMGTLFGLSPRMRFDLALNKMVAQAHVDHSFTIYGGNQWRPFLHIKDAARAFIKAIQVPLYISEKSIFNVGGLQQTLRMQELGNVIVKAIPGSTMKLDIDKVDRRNYRVSFEKIQRCFGFQPREHFSVAFNEIVGALQAGDIKDYKSIRYDNAKILEGRTDD